MDKIDKSKNMNIPKITKNIEDVIKKAIITEILSAGKGFRIYELNLEKMSIKELEKILYEKT